MLWTQAITDINYITYNTYFQLALLMIFCYDIYKGVKRMRRDENWAIGIDRVRAFFRDQADVREEDGLFIFGSCTIALIPQTAKAMNKWQIPRTQLIFEGDESDVQAIYRRFFLRFLSAGG